eukprot:GHVT01022528.1.p1 GENE.GHVT01022528.1~~GHVT01022528.1.p1  ORF type:complete len:181 (+),score=25.90 GHVT01022528.1:377-919(+)
MRPCSPSAPLDVLGKVSLDDSGCSSSDWPLGASPSSQLPGAMCGDKCDDAGWDWAASCCDPEASGMLQKCCPWHRLDVRSFPLESARVGLLVILRNLRDVCMPSWPPYHTLEVDRTTVAITAAMRLLANTPDSTLMRIFLLAFGALIRKKQLPSCLRLPQQIAICKGVTTIYRLATAQLL